jgi:uncharacterized membrane protein YoaT (DUF817 family)
MTLRQELSALTLQHCLHACVFSFQSQRDNTFYEPESRYDIFGTPRFYAFHYAGLGIYQFKNNQLEFRNILKNDIIY